jgi:hypothetical protein
MYFIAKLLKIEVKNRLFRSLVQPNVLVIVRTTRKKRLIDDDLKHKFK